MFQHTRVILFHNQATSARLRFLRFPYDSVCAFEPLPRLAVLMDEKDSPLASVHPAGVVLEVQQRLGLQAGEVEAEGEYHACVDIAGGPVNVLLLRFTGIDPPFSLAERLNASFIDLTQARDLPQVELELLRKAYELIIGD